MLTTDEYRELEQSARYQLKGRLRNLPVADAEEVLQDGLIVLVRKLEDGPVENPLGLLDTILRQKAIDRTRSLIRRAKLVQDVTSLAVVSPSTLTIEGGLFATDFDRALRALDEHLRDAFILYHLRGVTEYEAAQLLGIPAGTVVSRAELARKALAEIM